ncbi:DNA-directed RNA polymerase subunit alpha [bacterium]|nr:DNA-directed RNA polymerase subunit alpha [bacterium]
MKWKPMQMPKQLVKETSPDNPNFGRFILEPLEKGYGTTIGNALRRVILSSIQGIAITRVRIDGVLHEFSTIDGVLEDVPEIILNIKGIRFRSTSDTLPPLRLEVEKEGDVLAGEIQTPPGIEIINPEHKICTITSKRKLVMEFELGIGKGYALAEENRRTKDPVGVIPVDSIFTPIKNVVFHVVPTRVRQKTDYDKLLLEVTTDGSISPEDTIAKAAHILIKHFKLLVRPETEIEGIEEEEEDPNIIRMRKLFETPVEELELSVRSSNCLKAANIRTLGDLVQKTEQEMIRYKNFGKKSLQELTETLAKFGLSFGMDISKYMKKQPGASYETREESTKTGTQDPS